MKHYKERIRTKELAFLKEFGINPVMQIAQKEISKEVLSKCFPEFEKDIDFFTFEPGEPLQNLFVGKEHIDRFLKHFTHMDTRFDTNSVRLQGILNKEFFIKPQYINTRMWLVKDYFFIESYVLNYTVKNNY